MKMIVGLGNPGQEYNKTRHNIGFMIIDSYLENVEWKEKFMGLYCEKIIRDEKIIFLKPQTYMNLSGNSVSKFANFFKINPTDILVIHDDLDLPFGKVRLKKRASSGGHNGIKSIINSLGTDYFSRFKFGISSVDKNQTKDYVLGKFSKEEQKYINDHDDYFKRIIDTFIDKGIEEVMNLYNGNSD